MLAIAHITLTIALVMCLVRHEYIEAISFSILVAGMGIVIAINKRG